MLKSSKLRIWKFRKLPVSLHPEIRRRGARVVEEARLESVYTPKGYHEFESRSLRSLFHEILSDKGDVLGQHIPPFFFWGQRVVELFQTGIQITDKIPAGSHGLFPRDFSFACRCGVVVMALVEVAGFSLLLPLPSCRTSFQSLALCPGGGRQCGGFPFYTFCTTASPPALSPSAQRFGRVRFNIFRSASRDFGVRLLQRPLRPVAAGLRS